MSTFKSTSTAILAFFVASFVVTTIGSQIKIVDSSYFNSIPNNYRVNDFDSISEIDFKTRLDMDLEVLNYKNLSHVLRYKKLEIGIKIPDKLAIRINRYLKQQGVYTDELNPFLDWNVDVEATFYHEASGTTKVIDGFYTRDYAQNLQTDDWDDLNTLFPFRIRFAPPLNGEWRASISIRINKEQTPTHVSNDFWFQVIESHDPGYVTVFENNRNLKQGDKMIYPIGTNFPADFPCVAWFGACYQKIPGDPVRMLDSTNTSIDTIYYGHNLHTDSTTEKASNVYAWNTYLNTLSEYFQSGGKYTRTLQMAWSTLIEFEEKGNYYKRLHYAWEQDKILDSLEEYDVLMIFNMLEQAPHTKYAHNSTTEWDWDYDTYDKNGQFVTEAWVYDKKRYCYNDKPQGQKKAHESFTNESDLMYHKQRTRYYVARYGYSTKIMEFEILSEPFHVSTQSDVTDTLGNVTVPGYNAYEDGNVVKDAIKNYHRVLSEYMKDSLQVNQLVGIDMGHGNSIDLQSITLPKIDVAGVNLYYKGPRDLYDKGKPLIVDALWQARGSKIPILFSEGGLDEDYNGCSDRTQIPVDLMTFPFASVGGYLTWAGWRKKLEGHLWPAIVRAEQHMNGPAVISTLSEGGGEWWHDMQETALKKGSLGWDETELLVEQQHYRSANKDRAVGYVKNRTYNISTKGCAYDTGEDFNSPRDILYDDLKRKNQFAVKNLHSKTNYYVDWYSYKYGNYLKTDYIKTNSNGKLKLEFPTLSFSGPENPVVWFIAHKDGINGMAEYDETEVESNESILEKTQDDDSVENKSFNSIYPNPFTNEIIINSLEDDFFILSNSTGIIVKEIKIRKGRNQITVDNLAKGLYYARFKNQLFTTKIIRL
jgi:hypothetical protein